MKKRKLFASLLGAVAILAGVVSFDSIQDFSVQAAETESVFEMITGGSIRIEEPTGLRFRVKMSSDIRDKAEKVGMLIFPADYLVNDGTDGDVYYESVEAVAATTEKNRKIDLDLTGSLYETDGYWYGNGAIVRIMDQNMDRELTGIAYYTTADGETVWADTTQLANTTRRASLVALKTYADDSITYSQDTQKLLCNYIEYVRGGTLEDVALDNIPIRVDNGADVANSYWRAEYVDGGVKFSVNVIDENVSLDASNIGYSDNVEVQLQAVDNLWHTSDYSLNFLCTADGKYWVKRWSGSAYADISLANDPTTENDELYYNVTTTDTGYQVELFVSYGLLNVTEAEGKGKVLVCPMLRNRTDASYNVADCTYPLGCYYQVPTSWFMVDESNKFIRPDLDEFTLASRNSQATDIIANLASLTAEDGSSMAKTELGAHALKDSTWCLDGIARDLIGTDYLLSATADGQATVAEAGNVIICVKEANTALVEKLETEGWTLLADKCRTALGVMATGSNDLLYTTSYYYKNCEVGEVITTSGQYSLVFGKASDSTPEAAYKTTPAYISFDAVNEAFYKEEENINNCCPSLAVTNNGRLYACYMTGDEIDSRMENCGVVKYSDDDGKTWTPLFVLDTWENQVIGSTKQTVCFDIELKTDPETNVVYATYALRQNIDGSQTLDTQTWMFTISNPDSDTMTKDGLGISEQWNTGYGFSRNAFTILSDGTFMIIPNGTEHSEINHVYVSKDKGQTWNIFGDMYLPQAINSDEPVIVEKTDGSLWCLARTELGYLCQSFSYDDGKTWTVGRETDIQNPSSRFFITRLASGKLMMVHNDNTLEKIGMVVAISEDDGETWENKLNLHDGYASYPVVVLDNSTGKEQIHIIFDDGRDPDNQWRTGEEDGTKYKLVWNFIS